MAILAAAAAFGHYRAPCASRRFAGATSHRKGLNVRFYPLDSGYRRSRPCIPTVSAAVGPIAASIGFPVIPGSGRYSDTRVGWTAGGGFEWMMMPGWSVKAEALYYDLGSATFTSSPVVYMSPVSIAVGGFAFGGPLMINAPTTRVRYDGVIARVGVNYHFNWGLHAPLSFILGGMAPTRRILASSLGCLLAARLSSPAGRGSHQQATPAIGHDQL